MKRRVWGKSLEKKSVDRKLSKKSNQRKEVREGELSKLDKE